MILVAKQGYINTPENKTIINMRYGDGTNSNYSI